MNEPSRLQPQKETIGKGDTQRPFKGEVFRDHYDDIFRKDKKPEPKEEPKKNAR